jgi:hypothetical protein
MNTRVLAVVVIIIIIVVAGVSLYYVSSKLGSTIASSNTSLAIGNSTSVQVVSDNLTVGFQSGTWEITLKNAGDTAVSNLTVYLETPIRSEVCSGASTSSGLSFSLCPSTPGNPMPPAATISGLASGAGEGSAKVGSSYPVDAKIAYANGKTVWMNTTVTATQAP